MTRIAGVTDQTPRPAAAYSHSVRIGRIISVAGQAGIDPTTNELVSDDLHEQVVQTFKNIRVALAASGATLDDVIRVDVYLTDPADFAAMNAAYEGMFAEPYPTRTTVFVGLVPPLRVEITVLAVLPQDA
jgi:2-iminobutanoate/2-iminopropanoate deaminase